MNLSLQEAKMLKNLVTSEIERLKFNMTIQRKDNFENHRRIREIINMCIPLESRLRKFVRTEMSKLEKDE